MLETPSIPHYSYGGHDRCPSYSENVSGADNQQGSPLARKRYDPSETARQTGPDGAWKIQSELHGDMQSQAEMTWPSSPYLTARE